ncbi:MAG: OmpH family outer membrane protein [Candidatus Sericytochromatia bacterium]|nr:OmpH family outer membrane protein [Candidatus Sericytochromatia bacterium]
MSSRLSVRLRLTLIALASAACSLGFAPAASALTIGYVDTAKVLLSYRGARDAQGKMQAELVKYQQAFGERQKKIAEAQKSGKTPSELQKMTEEFERELKPLKDKAMSLEARLSGDVKTRIEAVIHRVAAERKLDLVLDKAAVLHGGVDITPEVIKGLK